MPGAAAVAAAQRVGGSGRGMGSLLAAVHPLGPGRLLLLLRACGAVCGLAGASTVAAGFCAVPASAEGVGHLLPNSGSTRGDAAACGLCASLGDIAEASRRALAPPPAAAEPAWNADRALPAAEVAARAPAPASFAAAGAIRAPAMTAPPTPVTAAPMATPVPTAPTAAPAIAPAPSCGAPDTRPVAIPGPKMPSASSASEASITTSAWSMDGSSGCTWNSANRPEPMPTMTASTKTLMPDDTTLPSTFPRGTRSCSRVQTGSRRSRRA